jgi:hypothetical protein
LDPGEKETIVKFLRFLVVEKELKEAEAEFALMEKESNLIYSPLRLVPNK